MRRSGRFIQATKLFGAWNAPDCVKTQTQICRWGYLCKKIQILALLWRNCAIFPQHLDIEWEIFQSRKKFLEFHTVWHPMLAGTGTGAAGAQGASAVAGE